MYKVEFYKSGQTRPFAALALADVSGIVPGQYVDFPPLRTGPLQVYQLLTEIYPDGLKTKVIVRPHAKKVGSDDSGAVWPDLQPTGDRWVPWPMGSDIEKD